MSKATRIQCVTFSTIFAAAILFIIVSFGQEMLNTKASAIFITTTVDNEAIEIIILTDKPYNENKWEQIESATTIAANQTKYVDLPGVFKDVMQSNDWSVITITATKLVYKIK